MDYFTDFTVRKVYTDEIETALSLVWSVFLEFDAPDYSEEGIDTFKKNIIESMEFKERLKTGDQRMFGAFINDDIIGLISISARNHISLVFVSSEYHRKGVASAILNVLVAELKDRGIGRITLNSSPYAIPFYHKIGFTDLDVQQIKDGIKYTPMEYVF